MLEVFLLCYLVPTVGKIAAKKGLNAKHWKAYTAFLWIGLELAGIIFVLLFLEGFTLSNLLIVYGPPVSGHFILRQILKKYPDILDDWVTEPFPANKD